MNSLRIARAAIRARPAAMRAVAQRRTYAEAVPDKIKLSMSLPHQSIYKSQDVVQVNIPAETGEMGVLANHVPAIEQLKPGVVEVVEESGGSKQFFLSGGFATVQPGSAMSINAVEGYPLEDFSADAIRSQIAEAQKVANGSGSEQDIAEAKIELETKQPANLPWLDESVTPTRVRVRQVEQDLAMKRAEELEAEAKEGERAVCDLATLRADKDEKWVAPDGHNCAWRDRYMDLNTELEKWKNEATFHDLERDQAGEEESTKVAKDAAAQVTRRRSADEVGIEGLTIVVHMRYKDDVVINTDLKDRGTGSVHSRRKM
ncbi:epsilon subunit of F1F0-ATP synthase N-terminal [Purpureocillium lavendulum]|uniref:ATP synthase subunit delta, mitochondrial n=1 Tax=Purpureocillium lavendulum TaxID=1247861 RepID=A0AB34G7D2_9HYPO|nr:epsilon subunit of F1F0-ATP synthase N-terminal [Purpureocillium lavendulum]